MSYEVFKHTSFILGHCLGRNADLRHCRNVLETRVVRGNHLVRYPGGRVFA